MKRQLAYFLVIFIGFLTLFGHFINYSPLNNFIDNDATQWFDIISGFAAFLGVINLLQLHLNKIANKRDNWRYSIITLVGFIIMIIFGFIYNGSSVGMGAHLKEDGSEEVLKNAETNSFPSILIGTKLSFFEFVMEYNMGSVQFKRSEDSYHNVISAENSLLFGVGIVF